MTNVGQRIDGLIAVCDVCLFDCLQLVNKTDEKCYLVIILCIIMVIHFLPIGKRHGNTFAICVRFYKCLQHDLS